MATNLALDDELLEQAVTLGGLKTKKATVTLALKEFIQRREAEKLIDTFGTVDFDANYNYKYRHVGGSGAEKSSQAGHTGTARENVT